MAGEEYKNKKWFIDIQMSINTLREIEIEKKNMNIVEW